MMVQHLLCYFFFLKILLDDVLISLCDFFLINFSSLHINGHPKSIYIVKVEMFLTTKFPKQSINFQIYKL
jgi:hypothetical protein